MSGLEVPDGITFVHGPRGFGVQVASSVYPSTTIELLDEALRVCPPAHRDALLDARHYLYPGLEGS